MAKPKSVSKTDQLRAIGILQIVVIALLALGFVLLSLQYRQLKQDVSDATFNNQLLYNEIDTQKQLQRPLVSPETSTMYIPELRITLPYNDTSKTLQYSYDDNGDLRVQSTLVTDHAVHVQSCYDMVRVKAEAKPNAYSPDQKLYASVTTQTGVVLQVYSSSLDDCKAVAWMTIKPDQIANVFRAAQSY